MTQIPGIIVDHRLPQQRARIMGTGIEVFEVIKVYHQMNDDWECLRQAFHWLSDEQLKAALTYYTQHKTALDARLEDEARAGELVAELWRKYPFTAPAN